MISQAESEHPKHRPGRVRRPHSIATKHWGLLGFGLFACVWFRLVWFSLFVFALAWTGLFVCSFAFVCLLVGCQPSVKPVTRPEFPGLFGRGRVYRPSTFDRSTLKGAPPRVPEVESGLGIVKLHLVGQNCVFLTLSPRKNEPIRSSYLA